MSKWTFSFSWTLNHTIPHQWGLECNKYLGFKKKTILENSDPYWDKYIFLIWFSNWRNKLQSSCKHNQVAWSKVKFSSMTYVDALATVSRINCISCIFHTLL